MLLLPDSCILLLFLQTMALYKWPALRLAFVPGIAEAFFDAGVATAVFGMPFTLALSLGFILKAVGPGLVVPAMFQLQKQGLGAAKGIPSTVVIAASFDDIIAITGFSILINIAIATGENAAWQIASGPLQVCASSEVMCLAAV
jgi:NhaP-type Na+/H+ or K+/H+ antiporter